MGKSKTGNTAKTEQCQEKLGEKKKEYLGASLEQYPSGHPVVGCWGPRKQKQMRS